MYVTSCDCVTGSDPPVALDDGQTTTMRDSSTFIIRSGALWQTSGKREKTPERKWFSVLSPNFISYTKNEYNERSTFRCGREGNKIQETDTIQEKKKKEKRG